MSLLWTAPQDVKDRWIGDEPLSATDAQLTTLLGDAEDSALASFPDLEERVAAENPPVARVKKVLARVVIRHLRNPTGLRTAMDTTGPYSTQVTYGGSEPGAIALNDEDRAELAGTDVPGGRAFTINTIPDYATAPSSLGWVSTTEPG